MTPEIETAISMASLLQRAKLSSSMLIDRLVNRFAITFFVSSNVVHEYLDPGLMQKLRFHENVI